MTSHPRIAAADAAQRAAAAPGASAWVAASAGTGKTKVLTDRVLALMLGGTAPERILCLTFTKAAAAEMANRLNQRLAAWAIAPPDALDRQLLTLSDQPVDEALRAEARRLFARVLDVPGGMRIQTIHSFCQALLKRFPLEAGLAPHFEVLDDRTAAELLDEAQKTVVAAAHRGADTALADSLATASGWLHADDFRNLMGELVYGRAALRRTLQGGVESAVVAQYAALGLTSGETPDSLLADACAEDAFDAAGLRQAAEALAKGSSTDTNRGQAIIGWLDRDAKARAAGWDDYVGQYLTGSGTVRKTLATNPVADAAPQVRGILTDEAERVRAAQRHRDSAAVAAASAAALRLGARVLEHYEAAKSARGLLDYDDLVLATRDLLDRDGGVSWVHYKLDGGIDHILVDEAQDTNPDQWAVVAALSDEFFAGEGAREGTRTVFAVGDEKQSIFSFQGADPDAFRGMRDRFADRVPAGGGTFTPVDLTVSFRSVPAVLRLVDAVFAGSPARDGLSADDAPVHHESVREGEAGRVEMWPPVAPLPAPDTPAWSPPVTRHAAQSAEARLARVIAGRIRRWIDDEEPLPAKGRAMRAGDIMVLVRRRSGFVEELVRALKACDVPVAGVDRMVLSEQIAVMDLIALGQALLMPDDDLTLATVLKSPLFGFDDDDLFALCHGRGKASLWRRLASAAADDPKAAAAQDALSALLARADFVSPFDLYAELLGAGRGRQKLLQRLGPEANDPIDEFLALAELYERANVPSLQGFLHWVAAGRAEIKRDLEQAVRDEVRIMTVHGAKGLQAPVVILPDTMQTPQIRNRLFWPDGGAPPLWPPRAAHADSACPDLRSAAARRQAEEHRRLLYVALTRAEDMLCIGGWQTRNAPPEDCWYRLVEAGMAQAGAAETEMEMAADAAAATACGLAVAGWSGPGYVLADPQNAPAPEAPALPGSEAPPPLPDWARALPAAEPDPPRPLLPSRPAAEAPAPASPLAGDAGAGYRRGRFVHRLLEVLAPLDDAARDDAGARLMAQAGHGLSADEASAALAQTLAVLRDPAYAALFGPGSMAEVPLIGRVGTVVMSGRIDRLHVVDDAVHVIDFKTGRTPPAEAAEAPAAYLRQLAAYRALLRGIYPDRAVRCALLWTDVPLLMPAPDTVLDRHAP